MLQFIPGGVVSDRERGDLQNGRTPVTPAQLKQKPVIGLYVV